MIRTSLKSVLDQDPGNTEKEMQAWIPYDEDATRLVLDENGDPMRGIDPETGDCYCDFHLLVAHTDTDDRNEHFHELHRRARKAARKSKRRKRGLLGVASDDDWQPSLSDQMDFWLPRCLDWVGLSDVVTDERHRVLQEQDPHEKEGVLRDVREEIAFSENRRENLWRIDGDFSARLIEGSTTLGHFLGSLAATKAGRVLANRPAEGGCQDQAVGEGSVEPAGAP